MSYIIDMNQAKTSSGEDLLKALDTSANGLSKNEAAKRLQELGRNEIAEHKDPLWRKILKPFWGPIPWMIEAAALLSLITADWKDFGVISFLLLINGAIDFRQTASADKAMAALKASLASKTQAFRDGEWLELDVKDLVPGDIIRVRLGDIIPADIKIIEGDYLLADEAALTGESLPVEKHVGDIAYSGAVAKQGEVKALVYGTGVNTFFGRTAKLVSEAKTVSHFQQAVVKIGDYLIALNFVLVGVVLLDAMVGHLHSLDKVNWWEEIKFCLVLTVASIPAALPAVLSVTMAVGAQLLSKKKAIISTLTAIEEMAGMDILCSDKTGTITKNQLTVTGFDTMDGCEEVEVKLCAALASEAENKDDPIDSAVIEVANADDEVKKRYGAYSQVEFKPFDPVSKRTEATVKNAEGQIQVAKGAPQVIIDLLPDNLKEATKAKVDELVAAAGERGYRTLGVGSADADGKWRYLGLIKLEDPPRDDSKATVEAANELGVEVKMITGDHGAIAKNTCAQVGIGKNILEAGALDGLSESQAIELVEKANGFSQVFPEHKYRIVELLQKDHHIVGMTGDGVNDAPALKKADAGTAVSGATDAARGAADLVLTAPGLSVIVDAIKEARRIFQRMQSYSIYRISETIDVLFFTVIAILVWHYFPVAPLMIILLAVFNDFPIMTISTDNVRFALNPENWNMRRVIGIATVVGLLDVFFTLMLFAFFYNYLVVDDKILHTAAAVRHAEQAFAAAPDWMRWIVDNNPLKFKHLQTIAFLQLLIAGNLSIFICRTVKPFWSIAPGKGLFWASLSSKLFVSFLCWLGFIWPWWDVNMIPAVSVKIIILVWLYAAIERLVISDQIKVWAYKLFDHKGIKFHRFGRVHK